MASTAGPGVTSQAWGGIALVAAVALLASLAGLRNELIQDDAVLIAQNSGLHRLGEWPRFFTSPYWPPPWNRDLYRPLTSLLLALQWAVGGGAPWVFRIMSYLLYAAGSVAVLLLARRLLPPNIALGAAALFAAHPVHVEAVALGVGQGELLVGLLGAVMVTWYLHLRRNGEGRPGWLDWAGLAALYLTAVLAKEHGLVLPGLLLATEGLLLPAPGWPRIRRLAPGYALLALTGALAVAARTAVLGGSLAGSFPAEALEGLGPMGRALTMLRVAPQWARLLIWPAQLQADYSPRELVASTGFGTAEAAGLALVGGTLFAAWFAARRAPLCSFGLAWTAIALFPVSNLVVPTGILLAERTLFLPSIGVVLALGGLVAALGVSGQEAKPGRSVALQLACVALVLAGVVRSAERHQVWRDEQVFTLRSVRDAPLSYRMQQAWGYQLFQSGRRTDGVTAYQLAIELAPPAHLWRVRNDLARRFWEAGANDLAVAQLRTSLSEAPGQEETRNYLVLGLLVLGRYADAAREADSALARGFSPAEFGGLRALADSAARDGAPPGSIKIRIRTGPYPFQ